MQGPLGPSHANLVLARSTRTGSPETPDFPRRAWSALPCRAPSLHGPAVADHDQLPGEGLGAEAAKNSTASAASSTVPISPSTVSSSMTFFTTSSSVIPRSFACSGICLSASDVRAKPGQTTLARTPCAAPLFGIVRHAVVPFALRRLRIPRDRGRGFHGIVGVNSTGRWAGDSTGSRAPGVGCLRLDCRQSERAMAASS